MALTVTQNIDLASYLTGGNFFADGGDWENSINDGAGRNVRKAVYYDRLDVIISEWNVNPVGGSSDGFIRVDPLFLNNSDSLYGSYDEPGTIGGDSVDSIAVGEWDRANNTQKVYVYRAASNSGFHEVNPLQLNAEIEADVWPNIGSQGGRGSAPTSGQEGFVRMPVNDSTGQVLIFETWGYAIFACAAVTDSGLVEHQGVMAQVDLNTGFGTILDSPVTYGPISNPYTEAQLFGQDVSFQFIQFVPDDLSTPLAPRGQVYLTGGYGSNPTDSGLQRLWLKVIDWNPLAVAGSPTRIHLRERLLTAVDLDKNNPGATDGVHPSPNQRYRTIHHPRTNRTFLISGDGVSDPLVSGEHKVMFLSAGPAVSQILSPSPRERIASGKVVEFGVEALGSLQEPIAGVSMTATLTRQSTLGEVLAVTPSAGESVATAFTMNPEDADANPVVVYKNGTPLTEGVDYTVDFANSEIDFIGPEPDTASPAYTIDYRHWGDPATPPHGTLLNSEAASDENGEAVFRVSYPEEDPVEDRWDELDVQQS